MGADCPIKIILKMTYFHRCGQNVREMRESTVLEADDTGAP